MATVHQVAHSRDAAQWRWWVGVAGEERAAAWYVEHGYRILARNWRMVGGELDLVCAKGGVLVICEVKSRRSCVFGTPFEAVTVTNSAACVGSPRGG